MIRKKDKRSQTDEHTEVKSMPKVEARPSEENPKTTANATEFVIQKIYVKDLSYESPGAPAIFRGQWKPEVKLELNTQHTLLEPNMYEVVLQITATIKLEDKTAFLVELKEAGIFTIAGLEGDTLEHALASFCPGIIFPYAREVISDLVVRGGFPQLNLAPINFEMVYQQSKKQQTAQKETAG